MPAEATPRAILRQLHAPDPVGRDVALLRTRLYRFSDDPRHYVLTEALEERLLAGHPPLPSTVARVRESLAAIRATGQPLSFSDEVAAAEDIDVTAELAARTSYAWQRVPQAPVPPAAVMIVGAPRSGTSHLFNLLAGAGPFGYFTTASCWAWPVRNLHHPRRYLFTRASSDVLGVDNKRTRVIPGLVMPGEAEDIWARALPAYRHIAGSGLYAALAQAADIPGVLAQRDHARQAAAGTATAVQIRDLITGSVTFTVAVRQAITSTSGTSQAASSFAVTLTPQAASWIVYDIEPASAGNS